MTEEGTFVEVRTIGRFCHEDDYLVHQQGLSGQHQAYKEQTINSLKHRLLVHLYRKAVASGEVTFKSLFTVQKCLLLRAKLGVETH